MNRIAVLIILLAICTHCFSQEIRSDVYTKIHKDSTALKIDSYSTAFKNTQRLNIYSDSIYKIYQRKGYINATYDNLKVNDTLYNLTITLNQRSRYHLINVEDSFPGARTFLGSSLSRKRNEILIQTQQTDSLLQAIHQELLDRGNLLNKVQLTDVNGTHKDTLTSTLKITLDKSRKLDRIVISGYDDFPKNIKNQLIPKKAVLNKNTFTKIESDLNNISFAEQYKAPQLLLKKDSTLLYIYLKKRNDNAAEGFIGINNTDGNTQITGNVNLRLSNNFNQGELIVLKYRSDDKKQRLLEINTELPYLFKSKLGLSGNLNITRRDTLFQNTQVQAGLFYNPTRNQNIALNYVNKISVGNTTANNAITNNNLNAVALSYSYDRLNNSKLMPINSIIQARITYGSRTIENLNTDNQFILGFNATKQFNLTTNNSLYIKASASKLISDNIQFNELFQLGGDDTIRGLKENSIDTSFYTTLQTEFRRRVGATFYVHTILDAGIFEQFAPQETLNLYGIGAGLGILTKSGILKLSLVNGSFNEVNINISNIIAQIRYIVLF